MKIRRDRVIKTPPGDTTRPTMGKVREALFNIWQNRVAGSSWLDLCAGSGSMGGEALCRGAGEAIAIELSGRACQVIERNWRDLIVEGQVIKVIRGDVLKKLTTLEGDFDLIYFDPPYKSELYEPVLKSIVALNLLAPDGEIAVEHNPKIWKAIGIDGLTLHRQKHYGDTTLTFYGHA